MGGSSPEAGNGGGAGRGPKGSSPQELAEIPPARRFQRILGGLLAGRPNRRRARAPRARAP
eukprot:9153515-Pyramimonas_sp.AAC.1